MCVLRGEWGGLRALALLTRPCGGGVCLSGRGTGEGRLGAASAFGSLRSSGLESVLGHPETCDVRLFPWAQLSTKQIPSSPPRSLLQVTPASPRT